MLQHQTLTSSPYFYNTSQSQIFSHNSSHNGTGNFNFDGSNLDRDEVLNCFSSSSMAPPYASENSLGHIGFENWGKASEGREYQVNNYDHLMKFTPHCNNNHEQCTEENMTVTSDINQVSPSVACYSHSSSNEFSLSVPVLTPPPEEAQQHFVAQGDVRQRHVMRENLSTSSSSNFSRENEIASSGKYIKGVCSDTTTSENGKPLSKWKRKQERERLMLPLHVRQKRRLAANARERKRMTSLNDAFARLRSILPKQQQRGGTSYDQSEKCTKELSKMEALQMAQAYIGQLVELLDHNDQH